MSWLAEPQLATQLFHRLHVRLRRGYGATTPKAFGGGGEGS